MSIKYPSTPYLTFSTLPKDYTRTEKVMESVEPLLGKLLVVTLKLDGSNACCSFDKVSARNGDTANHPSFDLLKSRHAAWKAICALRENELLYGEWLYARHSIGYKGNLALSDYFQLFAVRSIPSEWFYSWGEVLRRSQQLGVPHVPVLATVQFNSADMLQTTLTNMAENVIGHGHEGIVVRTYDGFHAKDFSTHVAKIVRANHVTCSDHWSHQAIVKNELQPLGKDAK